MGILAYKIFEMGNRKLVNRAHYSDNTSQASKMLNYDQCSSTASGEQSEFSATRSSIRECYKESCGLSESVKSKSAVVERSWAPFGSVVEYSLPDCKILIDLAGCIIEADQCFCDLMESSRAQLIDTSFREYIHSDYRDRIDHTKVVLEARGMADVDLILLGTVGEIPVWCRALAVYNESGIVAYSILFIKDERWMKNSGKLFIEVKDLQSHLKDEEFSGSLSG